MAREVGHRLRRSRSAGYGRAPDPGAVRGTAQFQEPAVHPDLCEYAGDCGRANPEPANHDRGRRARGASAECGMLLTRAATVRAREEDADADGGAAEDDVDA